MRADTTRRLLLGAGAAVLGIALAAMQLPSADPASSADEAFPGMAGTDTSVAPTDSALTVQGRGVFADMAFTVNQTRDLTNQAISIAWSGGKPTVSGAKTFFSDFVQVMQCWGEPDSLVPDNPGPPPENCVWGALNPTASSEIPGFATHLVTSRAFSNREFPDFDPNVGTVDEGSGDVYRDFVAVDGTVVTDHIDANATGPFDQYWLNPYFDSVKSNELPGVRTLEDGTGQALFTVNTGLELPGLGCGQRVESSGGGEPTVPKCWLVIVPRGTPEAENLGTPFGPTVGVASSPMNPRSWKNRIAIELEFVPLDSPCDIAADQRLISGTELALAAVVSWQPVLCTQPGLLPYAYGPVSDGLARQQLLSGAQGGPGMVAINRPLPDGASTEENPVVYAPLAVSAMTIAFNVERVGVLGGTDDRRLEGVRYSRINLTPRLVAKLLTQSYRSQVEIRGSDPYEWDDENPIGMFSDPDFLRFNPEFALWGSGSSKHEGGLLLPSETSDLALLVWEWILSDPEAAEWLAGEPDEWGMVVNPVYATTDEANANGIAFGSPPPENFPKTDPSCYQAPPLSTRIVPPPLCALDWFPYASDFADAARLTATATDGSRTILDLFAGSPQEAWRRTTPQTLGRRTIFGLTDLPSLTRFGLQAARLSRAGDNGDDRQFIAPQERSLDRAVRSMTSDGELLRLDPTEVSRGAYPLTTIAYAALRPLALDEDARDGYAAFLDYAAGPGQVSGLELGQLPPGYLPLPQELAGKTAAAAQQVRTLEAPVEATTTTTTPTTTTPTTAAPAASPPPEPPVALSSVPTPRSSSSTGTATSAPGTAPTPLDTGGSDVATPTTAAGSRGVTPVAALGNTRFAVTVVAVIALLSFLGALEITKRPRRAPVTNTRRPKAEAR